MRRFFSIALLIFSVGCPSDDTALGIDVVIVGPDQGGSDGIDKPDTKQPIDTKQTLPDAEKEDLGDSGPEIRGECVTDSDCEAVLAPLSPCRAPLCEDGDCFADALPNGKPCDDGKACTAGDKCKSGSCSGVELVCDDANDCTDDACDQGTGACVSTPNSADCDDGNPCTYNDTCNLGECLGSDGECPPCNTNSDCKPLEDGDLCNGTLVCLDSKCVTDPNTMVVCTNLNLSPCQEALCIPADGSCSIKDKQAGAPCLPVAKCEAATVCEDGQCIGKPLDCDDGNDCTLELCDTLVGCIYVAQNTGACSDGNSCTIGDSCKGGKCIAEQPKSCDDTNNCTADACNVETGECEYTFIDSACNDGDACTTGDHCEDGECVMEMANCDDGDKCTVDKCDSDSGCSWTPKLCNDGNPCTQDTCNPQTGNCESKKDGVACDESTDCGDESDCTKDICNQCGLCENIPIACVQNDNPCTNTECQEGKGCTEVSSQVVVCDDNNACTVGDHCEDGMCKSGFLFCDDKNLCTVDSCDPIKSCIYEPMNCDDGNPCTKDSCSVLNGCQHKSINCDDGNACTFEKCDDEEGCIYKDKICLDDDNACTVVNCEPKTGECMTTAIDCDDGDACTVEDCNAATGCTSGPIECNDNNDCTLDSCDKITGCVNKVPGVACVSAADCDDGNACTDDSCVECGTCESKPTVCDDGNPCTSELCDKNSGCLFDVTGGDACDTEDECYPVGFCSITGQCLGVENICGDGTLENPAKSCLQLKSIGITKSGGYYLKTSKTSETFKVHCEMSKAGGGWTLVAAIHKELAICSYATAIGEFGNNTTFIMGLSQSGTIPFTTEEIMVERYNGYVLFHSVNVDWNWKMVAKGTINSKNVADYGVKASNNGAAYVALGPPDFGGLKGPLLLMGVTASGQATPSLGVGAGYSGDFNQDINCKTTSGNNTGLLGGTMLPPYIWGREGNIYIR
jgi:hypothetical protein